MTEMLTLLLDQEFKKKYIKDVNWKKSDNMQEEMDNISRKIRSLKNAR